MRYVYSLPFLSTALLVSSLALGSGALALSEEEAMLEASMPSADNLERLKQELSTSPSNLDDYFNYAMLAKNLQEYEQAAWALETMLRKDDSLQRVKLELGLIYIELERFAEAKTLFQEVLASKPPKAVYDNVTSVLAALDERTKKHHTTISLLTGMNHDSNANSAPSSGNVTVVDTTIPLGAGAGSEHDAHGFAAIAANHSYDIDVSRKRPNWRWKSQGLLYRTEQDSLDQLDLNLYSVKTGPELTLSDIPLQAYLGMGYQHIVLNTESYLRNPRAEANLDYLLQDDVILNYNYLWEYRDYLNSATSTTYADRSGAAAQHRIGARYILDAKNLFALYLLYRDEEAKQLYLANDQFGSQFTYTHVLNEQLFLNLALGARTSSYDIPDLLISTKDRQDDEYSAGLTIGYKFDSSFLGDFTMTGTYQYRDVQSTIQNYEFDNHRIGFALSKDLEY